MKESGIFKDKNDKSIYVIFGGKIALGVGLYNKNDNTDCKSVEALMEMAELKESMPIGAKWDSPDVVSLKDTPTVKLIFNKIESIDTLIEGLKKMKEWLK